MNCVICSPLLVQVSMLYSLVGLTRKALLWKHTSLSCQFWSHTSTCTSLLSPILPILSCTRETIQLVVYQQPSPRFKDKCFCGCKPQAFSCHITHHKRWPSATATHVYIHIIFNFTADFLQSYVGTMSLDSVASYTRRVCLLWSSWFNWQVSWV